MTKDQAQKILEAKFERTEDEFFQELLMKLPSLPEEAYEKCGTFQELRLVIETYKKPSTRKSSASKTNTYYELIVPVADATEKAIGVVTSENHKHGSNRREHIQWIPMSQIIEENEKFYIPTWIISKNMMWNVVNRNSKMVK